MALRAPLITNNADETPVNQPSQTLVDPKEAARPSVNAEAPPFQRMDDGIYDESDCDLGSLCGGDDCLVSWCPCVMCFKGACNPRPRNT